jgi:DNA replication protein DnaC
MPKRLLDALDAKLLLPPQAASEELQRERIATMRLELARRGVLKRFAEVNLRQLREDLPQEYKDLARDLLALGDRSDELAVMAIGGPRGVGKTALACGLVRDFYERGKYGFIRDTLVLLQEITDAPFDRKEYLRDRVRRADLVVFDEVQERDESFKRHEGELVALINHRYAAQRATLILTNLEPEALAGNLGDSIVRRLIETGGFRAATWDRLDPLLRGTSESRTTTRLETGGSCAVGGTREGR